MRRLMILCSALLLAVAAASPAVAGGHDNDHDDVPEHPHVLLVNFELIDDGGTPSPFDDEVAFTRCVDLANNRALPLQAHHHSLHTGTAGFGNPEVGVTQAGHVVFPLPPFPQALPFEDCAQIEDLFGS